MDPKLTRRIATYIGICAAVTVPALVVAQQMINPPSTNFAAGELLRASDIDQLRDALVEAIGRINALEAGRTGPLRKSNVYLAPEAVTEVAVSAAISVTASCENAADFLVDCSCLARPAATDGNSLFMDLRQVRSNNANSTTAPASCTCSGQNAGTAPAFFVARAACLRLSP